LEKAELMAGTTRVQVFISYSHKDSRWLDRLQTALKPLVRKEIIDLWADTRIQAGQEWRKEITVALKKARVAVLLVSQNFLASDFIANEEIPPILAAAKDQGLTIVWIPVTASLWEKTEITKYQAAHDPQRPLDGLSRAESNRALVAIAKQIGAAASPSGRLAEGIVASRTPSAFRVVDSGTPAPHPSLFRDLEWAIDSGELPKSELGPLLLETLTAEARLEVADSYDAKWVRTGVRLADYYYVLIRPSAGQRDWQRDFAKVATPILVTVARSVKRSADAQALIIRLCEALAQRLRLRVVWPDDPDKLNDAKNALYRACLSSLEVESDRVLMELQGLAVVGPG
jgi:hypothetical protein